MAFFEGKPNDLIRRGEDGLVGLHKSLPQYRAWKHWLYHEFGKRFFPDWLTVTDEWPPIVQSGADAYAVWLSGIRDQIKYTKPVPRHPAPWDGFTPPETA